MLSKYALDTYKMWFTACNIKSKIMDDKGLQVALVHGHGKEAMDIVEKIVSPDPDAWRAGYPGDHHPLQWLKEPKTVEHFHELVEAVYTLPRGPDPKPLE